MPRGVLLSLMVGVLAGCQQPTPPEPIATLAAFPTGPDCVLADPILEDLDFPTRSSLEQPLSRALRKPYSDWTEFDRGIATKYLTVHFPTLTEADVLGSLFPEYPIAPENAFRRWLQLQGFAPGIVTFLLRNYTSLPLPELNRLIRIELSAPRGAARFADWLEVATHLDPGVELTRYVIDLHLAGNWPLATPTGCRYGGWCFEHLSADLPHDEQAAFLRAFADAGRDIGPALAQPAAIFAVDPHGFTQDASRTDLTGWISARLLIASGDIRHIGDFLRDPQIDPRIRAHWAHALALDPPPGGAGLISELATDSALPALLRHALEAPGTVPAPFSSCAERVQLLRAR